MLFSLDVLFCSALPVGCHAATPQQEWGKPHQRNLDARAYLHARLPYGSSASAEPGFSLVLISLRRRGNRGTPLSASLVTPPTRGPPCLRSFHGRFAGPAGHHGCTAGPDPGYTAGHKQGPMRSRGHRRLRADSCGAGSRQRGTVAGHVPPSRLLTTVGRRRSHPRGLVRRDSVRQAPPRGDVSARPPDGTEDFRASTRTPVLTLSLVGSSVYIRPPRTVARGAGSTRGRA